MLERCFCFLNGHQISPKGCGVTITVGLAVNVGTAVSVWPCAEHEWLIEATIDNDQCFAGQFQNAYPELMNLQSYVIEGTKFEEDVHKVLVKVTSGVGGSESRFVFILAVKDVGTKKGALMTRCLIRHQPR